MIIGFDGSRAFQTERTGTENYSYQLLKNLAKIDKVNRYIVYLCSLGTQGEALQGWPENFQFKTINWPRLWTQGGLALQTFKDQLDVLFVPTHTIPLIRKPGLKTVVTVHDLGSEYLPSMHQAKQRIYLGFMQKIQLQTATKIIAVSKATKNDLVKKIGIDQGKVEVVYEGYDQKLFRPIKDDVLINTLRYYNLQPKTYYLFVGTVQPRKNLERLIKAFAEILKSDDRKLKMEDSILKIEDGRLNKTQNSSSNFNHQNSTLYTLSSTVKLVLAGSKGWLSDEIYKLPKQLGIEERVKFLGYVPDEDLPALYSGAIALTFPSLFEGFGLPILEAQACGCPVITSDVSSMPEVAGPPTGGGAIYVDPYSIDDIVRGMDRLQVAGYRLQLVKKGFENVKRFSWEKCAKETLEVLESV